MDYTSIAGMDLFGTPFSRMQTTGQDPMQQTVRPQQKTAAQRTTPAQRPVAATAHLTQPEQYQTAGIQQPKAPAKTAPKPKAAEPVKTVPEHKTAVTATQPESPAMTGKASGSTAPVQEKKQPEATTTTQKSPVPAAQPKKELLLDMSSDMSVTGSASAAGEQERQRAHKEAEEAELQKIQNMSDEEVVAASIGRIKTDVERITRRNMKECVADHIQELCRKDPSFARLTLHQKKSLAGCCSFILKKAREYVKQEMEENDIKPADGYGCDIPDHIVLQWSEDYYFTDETEFIPKPYVGTASNPKKAASKAKKADKPAKSGKAKQETSGEYQQMSFV